MASSLAGAEIRTCIWTNHDFGSVKGATLTISARNGGYLTAFLAILVSVTGGQLWSILRFILHQSKARAGTKNAYYTQQQIILRNTVGTIQIARKLIQISWAWRRVIPRSFFRPLHLITIALTILAVFSVAGIFSSEISKAVASTVLLTTKNCGFYSMTEPGSNSSSAGLAFDKKLAADLVEAISYAQACYGKNDSVQCAIYVQQQIKYTIIGNVSCPFDESVCILKGRNVIELDTGLIDSHKDFGVNAPAEWRVSYRRVYTCAPLDIGNFTVPQNITSTDIDHHFDAGGPNYRWGSYRALAILVMIPKVDISLVNKLVLSMGRQYAIPQMSRRDADSTIFFLMPNSIEYIAPVDNPWFSAHRKSTHNSADGNYDIWTSDAFPYGLGCTEQHQYCNPSSGICTPLGPANQVKNTSLYIGLNERQTIHCKFDSKIILALPTLCGSLFGWITYACSFQLCLRWYPGCPPKWPMAFVKFAIATVPEKIGDDIFANSTTDGTPETASMCGNQKIEKGADYQNFSVLGICCIVISSGIIIIEIFLNRPIKSLYLTPRSKFGKNDHSNFNSTFYVTPEKPYISPHGGRLIS
ncbi:uncharacterized protein PAC_11198 [Phialocephala subalpina]|uniref:Uncharacterized protein n=1 Tax=Phialocephala subalpina TaxID=576137 RepID=A0A1L7X8G7_9HELO|nr:uncharacterized protein PAC_11198 [Phialocephala subalpina]